MSHNRYNFWKNAAGWPRDVGDMLFLAHAVHEVGKARFGVDWTADTPASTYIVDIDKFRTVVDDMARGFAEGRLSYALRPQPSGDFISGLPSHNWNSDLCEEIFNSCQMDSKALPVADRVSMVGSLWVFVPWFKSRCIPAALRENGGRFLSFAVCSFDACRPSRPGYERQSSAPKKGYRQGVDCSTVCLCGEYWRA